LNGETGYDIADLSSLPIGEHLDLIQSLVLSENETMIARPIIKEVGDRLSF
jgi:excinuclease ABC subunit A